MEWIQKEELNKLVVLNATGLAAHNEERCMGCGRYGCTDRGYTLTVGDPPVVINEAEWAQQVSGKLAEIFEANKMYGLHFAVCEEPQCVRKLKKSNVEAVLEKLANCGPDCHRNHDCAQGGVMKKREGNYRCPFRDEFSVCERNMSLDHSPLVCQPDKEGLVACQFHEEAYRRCFRRKEGEPCYDLKEKLCVANEETDYLLLLGHRFSVAPCRHCNEGTCQNEESLHFEGICSMKGMMSICEHYAPLGPEQAYNEGVCCYVSSLDGKDDRKIFNTSDYASRLSYDELITLCLACRISHSIAKATGLKCLGVRRSASNPFLNDKNPLHQYAIQVNYLYLTHPQDVAKYNPDLLAQAVFDALHYTCLGLGCEEIEQCNIIEL